MSPSAAKQLLLSWLLCSLSSWSHGVPIPGFQQDLAVVSPLCWMFIMQEHVPHASSSCISPLISELIKLECNFPAFSDFTPSTQNVGGTTLETSSGKVFLPGVLQALMRCFCFGLESCEFDGKVPCTSSHPREGVCAPIPASLLISALLVPPGSPIPAWASEVTWIQALGHGSSPHKHLCWFKAWGWLLIHWIAPR